MDSDSSKIQDRQNLDQAIQTLPESLQQLCLSGRSVRDLAHLVKNMLQITSGSAEIIQLGLDQKKYDNVERSWTLFQPNFIRLKKFVLDLIKYTKEYPLNKTKCDLKQCIDSAIKACGYVLDNNTVSIEVQKDEHVPATLLDPVRTEEIIANLITHAIDNLTEHTGTISITTKHLKDHNQIQLSVADDGPGLSDETIRTLAEPLERTRNMVGTGFDIPLAKLYVEQHNGYMEFESTPPAGNCVHIYLPIQ